MVLRWATKICWNIWGLMLMGGEDQSTLMDDFYSHTQKVKGLEESFAVELQVLAKKVISKRPNFWQGLDSVLKNQYAKQLHDHHSAAIVKSLLFQIPPQTSFTQFRSELSWILGTWNKKEHAKAMAVVTSQVGQEGVDEGLSKNQCKKLVKVAAQTAQIKDLHVKLDSAAAENTQMWEYLDPKNFQACITSVVQEAQQTASQTNPNMRYTPHHSRPYAGTLQPLKCSAGKDRTTNLEQSCQYCKDTRHYQIVSGYKRKRTWRQLKKLH